MSIPQLETCCCGCSLKTGTKIIGWLGLVGSILKVITFGLAVAETFYLEDHPEDAKTENAKFILAHLAAMKVLMIFMFLVNICTCTLSLVLLLGTYQQKANLVYIWVIVTFTVACVTLASNIGQQLTVGNPAQALFPVIVFLVDMYFVLVVYSFYREIRNVSTYP